MKRTHTSHASHKIIKVLGENLTIPMRSKQDEKDGKSTCVNNRKPSTSNRKHVSRVY